VAPGDPTGSPAGAVPIAVRAVTLRAALAVLLAATAFVTLTIAVVDPSWDPIHLVGLTAIAILGVFLLPRGSDPF
jgi:hypothetical protein